MIKKKEVVGVSFAKNASVLFFITLGVKVLSLFREVLMAAYIGMNQATDAYNIAILAASLITGIVGIAIGSSLIPVLAGIAADSGEEEKDRFFANVFYTMMVAALLVAGLLYVFAGPVIKILAPGFDDATVNFSVYLFQLGFVRINAVVAATFFTQYLNNKYCFYPPMIAASIGTIATVGYLLVAGSAANVATFMVVTVLGDIMAVLWMFPALWQRGFKFRLYWDLKDSNLGLFFSLSFPATANYLVQQIGIIITRALASQLPVGSISALSYANSIVMMLNMTVSLSIATAIFPRLAEALSFGQMGKAIAFFRQGIFLACVLLIPAAVGLIILAQPISTVLFERGLFTTENSVMTASALSGYSIGILAYAYYELASRFFNSMKDTKTPMMTAYAGVVVMIILSFLLYKPLKLLGLSLAASLMYIVMATMLLAIIHKRYARIFDKKLLANFLRVIVATSIMGIVLFWVRDMNIISPTVGILDLTVKIICAIFVYGVSIALLLVSTRNNGDNIQKEG